MLAPRWLWMRCAPLREPCRERHAAPATGGAQSFTASLPSYISPLLSSASVGVLRSLRKSFLALRTTRPDAMSSAQIKDRIREQYTALLEAFSNLLRSARLPDEGGDAGARQVSSLLCTASRSS